MQIPGQSHIYTLNSCISSHFISDAIKLEEQPDSRFPQLYTMPTYPASSTSLHSSFDQWSFSEGVLNVPCASPSSYRRQVPLARSIRGTERHTSSLTLNHHRPKELSTPSFQFDQALTQLPSLPSVSRFNSAPPASSRPHIPRPPNAFMLFRSDFLKKGVIPSHVERRQQNLSRIAGQCWNLLPVEEKEKWQEKAAEVLLEHQRQNPDYKFTPAPRGSRRTKSKGRAEADGGAYDSEDRIRQIREEYTQIAGPSAIPARRRRARTQNRPAQKDKEIISDDSACQAAQIPLPLSTPSTPSLPSPGQVSSQGPPLPPFFPQYSFPHVIAPRRPSTSLGFSTVSPQSASVSLREGFHLARPLSAASSETGLSTYLRDLDIVSVNICSAHHFIPNFSFQTPTAATFGNISMPSTPPMPVSPMTPASPEQHFPDALRDALPFSALNGCGSPSSEPACSPPQWAEDSYDNNSGSLLSALYSDDSFPFIVSPHDNQEYSTFEESYFSSAFGASMPEEWELSRSLAEVGHTYGL